MFSKVLHRKPPYYSSGKMLVMSGVLVSLVLFLSLESQSQSCLPNGITFTTQSQIDSFQINYPGCTEIDGFAEINGDSIDNLLGLSILTVIDGKLWISDNNIITTLSGLEGLTSIGGSLSVHGNPALTDISGLQNINSVGGYLYISHNYSLPDLEGLNSIETAGRLSIVFNTSLKNLTGLDSLKIVFGDFMIRGNDSLINLSGIEHLDSIGGYLYIDDNASLINISSLENIEIINEDLHIQDNPELISLEGLDNLTSIGGYMGIQNNSSLTSIGSLCQVITIGTDITDLVIISGNTSLISLQGLNSLTEIAGQLIISSNGITSLNGLESLTTIGHKLEIKYNHHLINISALENLIFTIGISVNHNDSLTSLEGLDNVPGSSLQSLFLLYNALLSECNTQTICEYFIDPWGDYWVKENAPGCNSVLEIKESCTVRVPEITKGEGFEIYPNPFTTSTTIEYELIEPSHVQLTIYNVIGETIHVAVEGIKLQGNHAYVWSPESLPEGLYYAVLRSEEGVSVIKMIKQ